MKGCSKHLVFLTRVRCITQHIAKRIVQKAPKIVAVGQTSVDTISVEKASPRRQIGGSAYIPARFWASWGISTGLVSCLGDGLSAAKIATSNLDLRGVCSWPEPTTAVDLHYLSQNLVKLQVSPGPSQRLAVAQIPKNYFSSRFFYISPAPLQFLLHLSEILKKLGRSLAFSPKEDFPSINNSEMRLLVSRCDICFINERELRLLTCADSVSKGMASLHEIGPNIVVVTSGPEGAIISTDGRLFRFKPPRTLSIANPLGAGDCFAAAFLARLLSSRSAADAGEHAIAQTARWLSKGDRRWNGYKRRASETQNSVSSRPPI